MKFTAYVLLFFAAFQMASGQAKVLKLDLNEGQTFRRMVQTESKVEQNINGEIEKSTVRFTGYSTYEVIDVNHLGYSFKVSYDSLIMHIEVPDYTTTYSSESADEFDLMAAVLSEMKNKPFKITVTPQGKILETQYVEDLFSTVDEKLKRAHFERRENIKTLMKKYFAGKGFISSFNLITHVFPEKAIEDKEKWIISTDIHSNYIGVSSNTYELIKMTPEAWIITGRGTITTDPKIAYIQPTGLPVAYDLKGETKSKLTFSAKTGWLEDAFIEHNFEGEEITRKTPEMTQDFVIPIKVETSILVKSY